MYQHTSCNDSPENAQNGRDMKILKQSYMATRNRQC